MSGALTRDTTEVWTLRGHYIVSNRPTGHDDEYNVSSYGGHLVCESIGWPSTGQTLAAALEMKAQLVEWAEIDCADAPRDECGECLPCRARLLLARINEVQP